MDRIIAKERANKIIYLEGDKCYKVFEESYNVGNVLNEALNHARIQDTDLRVPHLIAVNTIDKKWAIVTERINGKTLEKLIEEKPDKLDYYFNKFVDIQINMQSKRCPLLSKHRDKMNRKISETNLSSTLRYDLHTRIETMPHHNFLCHGDYNLSNVILDENENDYIIDWSHATQGNREADSARTYLLFLLEGRNDLARKYIDLYCEKSGCKVFDILNWLPILAASQSVKSIENETSLLKEIIFMDEKGLNELYEKV